MKIDRVNQGDGIHSMVPRENMTEEARKIRDNYDLVPNAPIYQREFGYYSLEAWKKQGLAEDAELPRIFQFDPPAETTLGQLGWCEAAFAPAFDVKIIEDRGETEIEQDTAGRHVLYFKGKRSGFMPEYVDHPVKDPKTWEEHVKWRLDPSTKSRYKDLAKRMEQMGANAGKGNRIIQNLVGGYMYLRSLIGPEQLLYFFYDQPELIHDCMKTWLNLSDAVIAEHQKHVTLDEIFLAEDICYNNGPLISPDMMREFLVPYYQQLIDNAKARQIDKNRKLFVKIDTDGDAKPVIPVYQQTIGMNAMAPFEVASGCDVVEIGERYPDLFMSGGIDKRILATTKEEIDRHVERIIPPLRERGGYIPTCDHGVPEEVSLENYLHFRRRCVELGN